MRREVSIMFCPDESLMRLVASIISLLLGEPHEAGGLCNITAVRRVP
jgi:hypothetical protein